jgi:Uncharacterised nucleotidyltransferase
MSTSVGSERAGHPRAVPRAEWEPGGKRLVFDPELWDGVGRLIDRAPSVGDLLEHRLELLAVEHWHGLGRPIPSNLVAEARRSMMTPLAAHLVLERIRAAAPGPILLLKGPEVAACYPRPSLRPFSDLDLLVPDPVGVQRALVAAGFNPVGDERVYADHHHLQPLQHPDLPVIVEIHAQLHWIGGLPAPPVGELFAATVPSIVAIDDVLALRRAHHAIVLAAHSWAHAPLGNLLQLIDVAAVLQGVPIAEADNVAEHWGIGRVWRLTRAAIDALVYGQRRPWQLHLWARHLGCVRGPTVLETHLARWLGGFWAFPPGRATGAALLAIGQDLRPSRDEDWGTKLWRAGRAVCNAFVRCYEHEAELTKRDHNERITSAHRR